jgi:hypothetical protein
MITLYKNNHYKYCNLDIRLHKILLTLKSEQYCITIPITTFWLNFSKSL